MKIWTRRVETWVRGGRKETSKRAARLGVEELEARRLMAGNFLQTNLVSDIPGLAMTADPNLVNPWGLVASATSPFWVSDNGTGLSTLYTGQGAIVPLVVNIPNSADMNSPHGTPTGIVFNDSQFGFNVSEGTKSGSSIFIFDTLDGTISGWNPGVDRNNAIMEVDIPGAVYTGLAIGNDSDRVLLFAADHSKGTIDVFDQGFKPVTNLPGNFTDPKLPAGASPFNVQTINGQLYVEYTATIPGKNGGPAQHTGFVDVYNTDGTLAHRLISEGVLDSPWGVALAPSNFGQFSNDLLVGNFGNGHINAFNAATGKFAGELIANNGQAFEEDHLWALKFGNGAAAGNSNTLFFTAGINGESDGLLGSLQAIASISPQTPILPNLTTTAEQVVSTIPSTNGDLNPYGVAFVPQGVSSGGKLQAGNILVSNFNDSGNTEGTGSTIVQITPLGQQSVFFQGGPGLGLTTALGVLKSGFVIVGNVPTATNGTAEQGSLLILDKNGNVVQTLTDSALLNGPWDLAINDEGTHAEVFVSNALSGSITRINLSIPNGGTPIVESETQIASGYAHRLDPNVVAVGPTGLAFDSVNDILYVASTDDNAIYAIPNAAIATQDNGTGKLIVKNNPHLHGPLGLVLAPNGDLIAANGDAVNPDPNHLNELVEFTPKGQFVAQFQLDAGNAGAAFGVAVSVADGQIRFAAVDDNTNTLDVWTFNKEPAGAAIAKEAIDGVFGQEAAFVAGTQISKQP
ncbi:MAG TPA: TIGR03118 family protein [Gemmataceae bacterium]|nr:TIGR03118 family protein [Gemmataceae bacterium]